MFCGHLPGDPDWVCAMFAVLCRLGEADVTVFVDPTLIDKEVLMDLHNSWKYKLGDLVGGYSIIQTHTHILDSCYILPWATRAQTLDRAAVCGKEFMCQGELLNSVCRWIAEKICLDLPALSHNDTQCINTHCAKANTTPCHGAKSSSTHTRDSSIRVYPTMRSTLITLTTAGDPLCLTRWLRPKFKPRTKPLGRQGQMWHHLKPRPQGGHVKIC